MIKLPEPFEVFTEDEPNSIITGYTEAQLKQAVRDAVEACARVSDCRDLPATSAAIRSLIKEIPQ